MPADLSSKDLSSKISTTARITVQSGPAACAIELRKSKRNLKRRNNGDLLAEDSQDSFLEASTALTTSTPHLASLSVPAEAILNEDHGHLFAPLQALESSPPPADLSLPDLPFTNCSFPSNFPDSPTPQSTQNASNGQTIETSDTPKIRAMLVDGKSTNTPTAHTISNHPAHPTAPNSPIAQTVPNSPIAPTAPNSSAATTVPNSPIAPNASNVPAAPAAPNPPIELSQEITPPPVVDDSEPDLTPISDHLANSVEYQSGLQAGNLLLRDPLDKYMKACFPPVHDAHPAAAYNNINKSITSAWDGFPNYKLIAVPFGFESRLHLKHGVITRGILTAIAEITDSQRIGISPPAPEERTIKNRSRTPYAFLVHGLSKEQYQFLLRQRIWASVNITFRIMTTKPSPPDLLFSITELSSLNSETVHNMVLSVWSQESTIILIQDIIQSFPQDASNMVNFRSFLTSLKIDCVTIKEKGGRINPIYNTYADNRYFRNHSLWSKIRSLLAGLRYGSAALGCGVVKVALFHCNICHGVDHPRGLCPFPKIQGWCGPLGLREGTQE